MVAPHLSQCIVMLFQCSFADDIIDEFGFSRKPILLKMRSCHFSISAKVDFIEHEKLSLLKFSKMDFIENGICRNPISVEMSFSLKLDFAENANV